MSCGKGLASHSKGNEFSATSLLLSILYFSRAVHGTCSVYVYLDTTLVTSGIHHDYFITLPNSLLGTTQKMLYSKTKSV